MIQIIPENRRKSGSERFNEAMNTGLNQLDQYFNKDNQSQALKGLGLDPSVMSLPEQAQSEYFKNAFARDKPLNPLQEAQMNLAQARTKQAEGQQDFLSQILGKGQTFGENLNQENVSGNSENGNAPQSFNWSNLPESQIRKVAAFAGQPGEAGVIGNMAQGELNRLVDEKKLRTDKEKQFFKLNEPKLTELSDTLNKLETEGMRYDRLQNLFSNPDKFPSSFTAALFSKEGQLNDIAYSLLTPEAQEAIKLIIDSTSNIKDTYGARVTNFDLQTYLKKLPSLLNTSEGKMRVLRDLKIMNEINQLHARGIQKIFEDAGGSDKIPYSTAESRYKKEFSDQEKQLKNLFVNPEKGVFKDLPNASMYLGRKIKNPETGEIFISDGNEWKPFKE